MIERESVSVCMHLRDKAKWIVFSDSFSCRPLWGSPQAVSPGSIYSSSGRNSKKMVSERETVCVCACLCVCVCETERERARGMERETPTA